MGDGGGARAVLQCCTITLLQMNRLNKTVSAIFVSLVCSLLPEELHSELILVLLACEDVIIHPCQVYFAGPRSAIGRAPDS